MARGRPAGSKNKPKIVPANTNAPAPPPANHNELSEEQLQGLMFRHKERYEHLLGLKKVADKSLKDFCKIIKADLGDGGLDDIKVAIQLETAEGEARFKERMERQARVARWMGLDLGTQGSLFGEDRRPGEDKAFEEGKRAGMSGKERRPPTYDPSSPQARAWLKGYDAGQEVNRSLMQDAIKPLGGKVAEATGSHDDAFDDALDDAGDEDDAWDRAAPESVA